jgi:hypothetical protein
MEAVDVNSARFGGHIHACWIHRAVEAALKTLGRLLSDRGLSYEVVAISLSLAMICSTETS